MTLTSEHNKFKYRLFQIPNIQYSKNQPQWIRYNRNNLHILIIFRIVNTDILFFGWLSYVLSVTALKFWYKFSE